MTHWLFGAIGKLNNRLNKFGFLVHKHTKNRTILKGSDRPNEKYSKTYLKHNPPPFCGFHNIRQTNIKKNQPCPAWPEPIGNAGFFSVVYTTGGGIVKEPNGHYLQWDK